MSQRLEDKRQLFRFGLIGGINTVIDFCLLFLLKSAGLPVITSNIISSTTAFVFSFFANKNYTFRSQGASVVRQMVLFTVVTLFGIWMLQTAIIQITLPWFSALTKNTSTGLLVAKLCATAISLIWNYVLYAKVVFLKKERV